MDEMTTYTATARRSDGWWVIQCDQLPAAISQVRSLNTAAEIHREAIAFVAEVPDDQVSVTVRPEVDTDVRQQIEQVRALREQVRGMEAEAEAKWAAAASTLHERDWTYRDIGKALSISYQRVHQLVDEAKTAAPSAQKKVSR